MKPKKHSGKTALVTGATDGIGLQLAHCCVKDGYNVILVARTQENLEKTAQEIMSLYGVKAYGISADLMEPENAFRLYEEITGEG